MTEHEYSEARKKIINAYRNKEIISYEAIRQLKELEAEYRKNKRRRKANGNKSE